MKENSSWFRLLCLLTMLEDHLPKDLGLLGEGISAKDILRSQEWLQQHLELQEAFELFYGSKYQLIRTEVNVEQWIEHWKKANKIISSSYSRIHFGHCKAHAKMVEMAKIKRELANLAIRGAQPLTR